MYFVEYLLLKKWKSDLDVFVIWQLFFKEVNMYPPTTPSNKIWYISRTVRSTGVIYVIEKSFRILLGFRKFIIYRMLTVISKSSKRGSVKVYQQAKFNYMIIFSRLRLYMVSSQDLRLEVYGVVIVFRLENNNIGRIGFPI